jgi:hypothetical protein
MQFADLPQGVIDWSLLPSTVQPGIAGAATARSRTYGDIQLRVVEYGAGYIADHWCAKGHILFVIEGDLVIEHQDGTRYPLTRGMTWHVADENFPPHRVVCGNGAKVFIID